jgi:hypothetical protein
MERTVPLIRYFTLLFSFLPGLNSYVASVADPRCLSRILLFSIPDPNCFHLGSRIRINLSILTQKMASKL